MCEEFTNAKEELINKLKLYDLSLNDILCGFINIDIGRNYKIFSDCSLMNEFKDNKFKDKEIKEKKINAKLKVGYTENELDEFLNLIDEEYYSSYGAQELGGKIWMKNNTWFEREEYDGKEWWTYKKIPKIPKELQKIE